MEKLSTLIKLFFDFDRKLKEIELIIESLKVNYKFLEEKLKRNNTPELRQKQKDIIKEIHKYEIAKRKLLRFQKRFEKIKKELGSNPKKRRGGTK